MVFVVDEASVLPVGKPTDILAGNSPKDLLNDLFALTPRNHVDIRTTAEEIFDFLRCFMPSDNRADLRRQLGHEITNLVEPGFPRDAHAEKIDLFPDKLAERLRVLVCLLVPKVKERYLPDEVFHARDNVLQARWREKSLDSSVRIPEIRVQGKSMFKHVSNLTFWNRL